MKGFARARSGLGVLGVGFLWRWSGVPEHDSAVRSSERLLHDLILGQVPQFDTERRF